MIELVGGAGIALISALLGFALGRAPRRAAGPARIEPICPCRHSVGAHDPKTGRCNATIDGPNPGFRDAGGKVLSWEQIPCPCLSYSGPELISLTAFRELSPRLTVTQDEGDHR